MIYWLISEFTDWFQRERKSASVHAQVGRDEEGASLQVNSPLSGEPEMGLDLMTH